MPSAFIPFCEFGGSMDIVGVKVDEFRIPVCNSFKAKILNDQLCYEIDLNDYDKYFSLETLRTGFTLFVDKNEDSETN